MLVVPHLNEAVVDPEKVFHALLVELGVKNIRRAGVQKLFRRGQVDEQERQVEHVGSGHHAAPFVGADEADFDKAVLDRFENLAVIVQGTGVRDIDLQLAAAQLDDFVGENMNGLGNMVRRRKLIGNSELRAKSDGAGQNRNRSKSHYFLEHLRHPSGEIFWNCSLRISGEMRK